MHNALRQTALTALALVSLCASATLPGGGLERGPQRRAAAAVETQARVIVKYRTDSALMHAQSAVATSSGPQHAQALAARTGLALTDGRTIGARGQVLKAAGLSSQQLAERLGAEGDVEYAVVDRRVHTLAAPNDPLYPAGQVVVTPAVGQWYLRAPTSATIASPASVVSSIDAEAAWGITTGSSSVIVAVLDTGVRFDHPDLASKLLPGRDFISSTSVSNDGDGRDTDASDPGDYGCGQATSSWHGTQTAGLIAAATNNGIGMAGAGRDVTVLPVRVLGCGGGWDSDIQAAMLWAAGVTAVPITNPNPAKVLNLSLGSKDACNQAYADVIARVNAAGAVVVVAAGNDGLDVGSPANCAGAIAVAGVRHSGTKVGYSDLGSKIAIAAPAGNCVNASGTCLFPLLTTSNTGTTTPVSNAAGGSKYTSGGADASLGTSFSAPLVSGTVGLMFSANPALTPAQVLSALKSSARPFPATGAGTGVSACTAPTSLTDTSSAQDSECYCTTTTCGAGLLDAGAAVAAVASVTANIAVSSASVVAGESFTLDGSGSRGSLNRSISVYQWAITGGDAVATFSSATNASTATLATTAAGSLTVSLTVTDSDGQQATASRSLSVTAPAIITAPTATTSSSGTSGGGGGAMQLGWLLAWLGGAIAVRLVTPRQQRG
jgi:serine protease